MTDGRRLSAVLGLLRIVLFAPFVAFALVPQGVMPDRAGDGRLTLVLCSGSAPIAMVIDLATGLPVLPGHEDADNRCDWAAGQMGIVVPARVVSPQGPILLVGTDPVHARFAYAPAHDPRGIFARGPPDLI